ncbi:MAG: DNA polymerase III subunit beta [Leadbetterella sp.]
MKFIVSSTELVKNLSNISGLAGPNPLVPILENFLFELDGTELTVTASDMQTIMVTEILVESTDKITVAVPAKMLMETLRNLPEQPLTFNFDADSFGLEIVSSNGRYKISGENPVDFPRAPEVNKNSRIELSSHVLAAAINNTVFSTGTDELRPAMAGVYINFGDADTTFVATDGHRLVRYRRNDLNVETPFTLILPRKALNLVKASLPSASTNVVVEFSSSNAFFSFGNVKLICRLIDERYPDYDNVIPKNNPNVLTIERTRLLSCLKIVSVYSNKSTYQVRFKISQSELIISAEDLDYSNEAVERLPCEFQGDAMEIGFNAKFMMEMLNNLDSPTITLQMSQPNRAGIIVPLDQDPAEDILMLVMPVMLSSYGG